VPPHPKLAHSYLSFSSSHSADSAVPKPLSGAVTWPHYVESSKHSSSTHHSSTISSSSGDSYLSPATTNTSSSLPSASHLSSTSSLSLSLKQQKKQQSLLLAHPRPSPPGLWRCDVTDALLARSRGDARAVARRADESRRGILAAVNHPSAGLSGGPSAPIGVLQAAAGSAIGSAGAAAAAVEVSSPDAQVVLNSSSSSSSLPWQQTREGFERLTRALASAEQASSETVLEFLRTRRGKAEKEEVQERVRKDGIALAWQPRIRAKPPAWNRIRTVVAHLPLGRACLGGSGSVGGSTDGGGDGITGDLNEHTSYQSLHQYGSSSASSSSSDQRSASATTSSRFGSRSRFQNIASFKAAKRMRIDALFEARVAEV